MVNRKWNTTQKLYLTLEPSDYKQLLIPTIRMLSAERSILFRDVTSGGCFLLSPNIFGRTQYVRIRAYMSRRRVPNHEPVCELHTSASPPPLLLLSLEWTTNLVGHKISTTADKTSTSEGLAWRLNKSGCNSGNMWHSSRCFMRHSWLTKYVAFETSTLRFLARANQAPVDQRTKVRFFRFVFRREFGISYGENIQHKKNDPLSHEQKKTPVVDQLTALISPALLQGFMCLS